MKIILIRHAQTLKNKDGIMQGREDSDFTEEGKNQISNIVNTLTREKIEVVFCSSLGRALKTAEEISESHNLKTIVDDRLMEIKWENFSNLSTKKVISKWEKYYAEEKNRGVPRENIRPPNGENSFDHAQRIKEFIDDLKTKYMDKTIVVVGHSGTNKVFIGVLEDIDPEKFYEIEQDNGCINYLEIDNKGKLVKCRINITDHLKP